MRASSAFGTACEIDSRPDSESEVPLRPEKRPQHDRR